MYKKITKADQKNQEGGYKQVVFWCPMSEFLTVAKPVANPTIIGQRKQIVTAHTFAAGNGFYSFLCKKHSVTTTAESIGDDGSKSLLHKFSFEILGDSESTLEQMEDLLNDNGLWLLKDQDCINTTGYNQYGDDCLQSDHTVSFDGKTTKEGLKIYKIEGSVKAKKFFYSGAVTEKPSSTAYVPVVSIVTAGPINQAASSTLVLLATGYADVNAPNQYVTLQWNKNGVPIANAFGDYYMKVSTTTFDSGSYTCTLTDAYGTQKTSTAVVVTIS